MYKKDHMKKIILLVEDDPDGNLLISYILTHRGYDVRSAASAEDALEMLKTIIPDIIIADISLPKMDGKELIKRIRLEEKFSNICAIAVTAFVTLDNKYEILNCGFDDFIKKPVQVPKFVDEIEEIYLRKK